MKQVFILLTFLALSASPYANADSEFPPGDVTLLVNYGTGGAVDRAARLLSSPLATILDKNVLVENVSGAGGKTGLVRFLEEDASGQTLLVAFSPPTSAVAMQYPDEFSLADIEVINVQWTDPGLLYTNTKTGWTSIDQMIEAVKANPGDYVFGSSGKSSVGTLLALDLFDKLGLELKIATYDGGGETRKALQNGEVDVSAAGISAAAVLKEEGVPLGVFWDQALPYDDIEVEPLTTSLHSHGISVENGAAYRFVAVHSDLKKKDPALFNKIVAAVEAATTGDAMHTGAKEGNMVADWLGPEASRAILEQADQRFAPLIKRYVMKKN